MNELPCRRHAFAEYQGTTLCVLCGTTGLDYVIDAIEWIFETLDRMAAGEWR